MQWRLHQTGPSEERDTHMHQVSEEASLGNPLWPLVPLHINCLFAPQVVLKGDAKKLLLYGVSVLGYCFFQTPQSLLSEDLCPNI